MSIEDEINTINQELVLLDNTPFAYIPITELSPDHEIAKYEAKPLMVYVDRYEIQIDLNEFVELCFMNDEKGKSDYETAITNNDLETLLEITNNLNMNQKLNDFKTAKLGELMQQHKNDLDQVIKSLRPVDTENKPLNVGCIRYGRLENENQNRPIVFLSRDNYEIAMPVSHLVKPHIDHAGLVGIIRIKAI